LPVIAYQPEYSRMLRSLQSFSSTATEGETS
jgi:hypothetical protein